MSRNSDGPASQRVRHEIIDMIATWPEGHLLPGRNALADRFNTNPSTVDQVLRKLAEEGYVTGGSGKRRLVTRKALSSTRAIAILVRYHALAGGRTDFNALAYVAALSTLCATHSIAPLVYDIDSASPEVLRAAGANAVIAMGMDATDLAILTHLHKEHGLPVVTIGGPCLPGRIRAVAADNYTGIRLALDCLLENESTDVGFCCHSLHRFDVEERFFAFLFQLCDKHRSLGPCHVFSALQPTSGATVKEAGTSEWSVKQPATFSAVTAVGQWLHFLQASRLPSAIVCGDRTAHELIVEALLDKDLAFARHMRLLVFDEVLGKPHESLSHTMVHADISHLAEAAFQLVVRLTRHEPVPDVTRVPMYLTASPASAPLH